MIMPGPGRRQDQISGIHVGPFTIHSRVGPFSLDDESQGRLGMAMSRCDFSRKDQLQAGIQGIRSFGLPPKIRIFKNQDPPLGFLGADDFSGFQ